MLDWTQSVQIGTRGRILFTVANSFPVVQLQVKLGEQVIAEINGTELRDVAGLSFSVPRTAGAYNITVAAKDSTGCAAVTTTQRSVNVF